MSVVTSSHGRSSYPIYSIDIACAAAGRDGEIRHVGTITGDCASLVKALRRLSAVGHRLHVVYEAGPCGYVIRRHLSALGITVQVVAPSSIREPGAACGNRGILDYVIGGPVVTHRAISDPRARQPRDESLKISVTNPRISALINRRFNQAPPRSLSGISSRHYRNTGESSVAS